MNRDKLVRAVGDNGQLVLYLGAMLLLPMVVYWRDLRILVNEAVHSAALSHVLLIPFMVGYLLYRRAAMLRATLAIGRTGKNDDIVDTLTGVGLCIAALLLHWYGSYTFYPLEYHLLSLPFFLLGVTMVLLGWDSLLVTLLPLSFLFLLVPPPAQTVYSIGGTLANINTYASHFILRLMGLPVELSSYYGPPALVLLSPRGAATFSIDVPCSGVISFIGFMVFALFVASISPSNALKKATLFLLGFTIFDLLNILRITTIVTVAHLASVETAMSLFHLMAGAVLTLVGIPLTLILAERVFKIQVLPEKTEAQSCPNCKENNVGFCASCGSYQGFIKLKADRKQFTKALLLLVCFSAAAVAISAPLFVIAQGPMEFTSNPEWENSTDVFPVIPGYYLSFLYRDTAFERRASQDASLVYNYFPESTEASDPSIYVLVGVDESLSDLHSWEVCLISIPASRGQTPSVSVLDREDVQLLPDIPLIAKYLVFDNPGGTRQVTLYWYTKANFKTGVTVQQKYVRISLVIYTRNKDKSEEYREKILNVGREIAAHWKPLETRSFTSLGVPAQQLLLALALGATGFIKTTHHLTENMRRTRNRKMFMNLGTEKEKKTLQAIRSMEEGNQLPVTSTIQNKLNNKGEEVNPEELNSILRNLEEYGFIKRKIHQKNSTVYLTWKYL